jgi:RNA recognition motif-containing protein
MATEEQAAEAIKKLNGSDLGGRKIVVDESKPQEKKSFGGGDNRRPRTNRAPRY